jgi:hypothetical protein
MDEAGEEASVAPAVAAGGAAVVPGDGSKSKSGGSGDNGGRWGRFRRQQWEPQLKKREVELRHVDLFQGWHQGIYVMAIKLNGNDCSIVDTARKLTSESDDIINDDESAHHHTAPRNNPSANEMPMMNKFTAQWMG